MRLMPDSPARSKIKRKKRKIRGAKCKLLKIVETTLETMMKMTYDNRCARLKKCTNKKKKGRKQRRLKSRLQ